MPAVPAGGEGNGTEQFSVSPQTLLDASPTYYKASQNINTLQQTIDSASQLASGDMFILLEFAQLASRLEQLQARIDVAMQCASLGLSRIGDALAIAANEYWDTDAQVSGTFTRIENDPTPWNIPGISPLPGSNSPGGTPQPWQQPQPTPQPQPWWPFPWPEPQQPGPVIPIIPIVPEI